MLQQAKPDDYILASGIGHTVAELAEVAFEHVGLAARDHIRVDPGLVRPPRRPGRSATRRARERLGWRPLPFEQLIHRMVDADLRASGYPAIESQRRFAARNRVDDTRDRIAQGRASP